MSTFGGPCKVSGRNEHARARMRHAPLILRIDNLHRQTSLRDLFSTNHHRLVLVSLLFDHATGGVSYVDIPSASLTLALLDPEPISQRCALA
jgi:hypothetical protein